MLKDDYHKVFANKTKALFIFSHPDDAEIYAGGTIARLLADKKEVCVVKMTLGNKGSKDTPTTEEELSNMRMQEDTLAMSSLGVSAENNIYLKIPDGAVENDLQTIEKLVKVIRRFKPDIVITHNPEDVIIRWGKAENWVNHRDHRNTGKSVLDAAYPYSRDLLFFPEHFEDKELSSHKVSEFLLIDYWDHVDNVAIDVTDYMSQKVNAVSNHSSQYSLDHAKELSEFITRHGKSDRNYELFRYVVAD